jgi:hypothetical protein
MVIRGDEEGVNHPCIWVGLRFNGKYLFLATGWSGCGTWNSFKECVWNIFPLIRGGFWLAVWGWVNCDECEAADWMLLFECDWSKRAEITIDYDFFEAVAAIGASRRYPDDLSLIINSGRLFPIFNIRDFLVPIIFKMAAPCLARYSNSHRANSHHSMHIIKAYHRTRTGFCVILICSTHLFWNDTLTKVSEPTCSFALRSKLSTSSDFK